MVSKKQIIPKWKITATVNFGPYKSPEAVSYVKREARAKAPSINFSSVKKTSRGYTFTGKILYVKRIPATKQQVQTAFKQSAPRAKISVTRA